MVHICAMAKPLGRRGEFGVRTYTRNIRGICTKHMSKFGKPLWRDNHLLLQLMHRNWKGCCEQDEMHKFQP